MPDNANSMNFGQPGYPDPNDPAYYDPYMQQQAAWGQGQYPQGQPMQTPDGMYDMGASYMQNMQSPQDIYANQGAAPIGYDPYGNPIYGQGMGQGYQDPMAQQMGMDPNAYGYQQGAMPQDPMMSGAFPAQDPAASGPIDMGAMGGAAAMQAPGMTGGMGAPVQAQMPQAAPAPQPEPAPQAASAAPAEEPLYDPLQTTKGKATICLVFGLLSILFGLIPPIGAVFGILGYKKSKKYFRYGGTAASADSGRVFSVVGLVFSGLMFVFLIGFISYMVGAMTGNVTATSLITFFNQSPLGSIITIPVN